MSGSILEKLNSTEGIIEENPEFIPSKIYNKYKEGILREQEEWDLKEIDRANQEAEYKKLFKEKYGQDPSNHYLWEFREEQNKRLGDLGSKPYPKPIDILEFLNITAAKQEDRTHGHRSHPDGLPAGKGL